MLNDIECNAFIELARPTLTPTKPGQVTNPYGRLVQPRSYLTTALDDENPFIAAMNYRFGRYLNYPLTNPTTPWRVLKYIPGDRFPPHMDRHFMPPVGDERWLTTLILYLNDVTAGGATVFPRADLTILPKKGHALVFGSASNGKEDPMALHAGADILEGEKWIVAKWFIR